MAKQCKDCEPGSKRPTPHPGPRCATHHREFKKASKARSHDTMVQKTYGLGPGDYERLYEAQGGRCAVLKCRATGRTKRLAVDHNHTTGEVRGLLCGVHNQLIGYNQDSPEVFDSLAEYLRNPPARKVLVDQTPGQRVSSDDDE